MEAGLELPDAGADEAPARGHSGSPDDGIGADNDEAPPTRLTARPRAPAPVDRPVYKVRRHDTLRSIARDVLGDSRRADELYDLNRDIIDDPTRLTAGQLLELPEDADTRRVTVRDRYRAGRLIGSWRIRAVDGEDTLDAVYRLEGGGYDRWCRWPGARVQRGVGPDRRLGPPGRWG